MDDVPGVATCVGLLRGVNVGGRNRVPMKELVALVEALGGRRVRTYIQSGNVIFDAPPELRQRAATALAEAITERFGVTTPVVLRTAGELADVVGGNPYLAEDADEGTLHVGFLAEPPRPENVATLDPRRSDEFTLVGREIYLRCPNGVARSKLTNAYFDSRLGTVSTMRNWRTVRKLLELAEG